MRPPRFRTKDFLTCMGSTTARGPMWARKYSAHISVAFSSEERNQHPGIKPISQLNTQPMVPPVNASRLSSRITAHHSGPKRLARPYFVEDFHLLSFASLSWRTLIRARFRNAVFLLPIDVFLPTLIRVFIMLCKNSDFI